MVLFAAQPNLQILGLAVVAILAACGCAWTWIAVQWRKGRVIVPYQLRRTVPWQAIDLFLIIVFHLSFQSSLMQLGDMMAGAPSGESATMADPDDSTTEHVVGQLIAEGNGWVFLLCCISAIVVAPAVEEFLFRILIQGWLEAVERRWRREFGVRRWKNLRGVVPVVLVAAFFASLHFRASSPKMDIDYLVIQQFVLIVSSLGTLAFAVWWVRWRVGATWEDLGWSPGRAVADAKLGLGSFAAIAAPMYAMQIGLQAVLPEDVAPDPIPLFFFALVLGFLYYRTHRFVPVFSLHAALNGVSLAMAWFAVGG